MVDIRQRSFRATLHAQGEGVAGAIECSVGKGVAQDGWLVHRSQPDNPLVLCFDYVSDGPGRVHYHISAGPATPGYAGARLGVSANGYLGLYQVAEASHFWKVQVTANLGASGPLEFVLRDHRGHVVKSRPKRFSQGSFWTGATHLSPVRQVDYLSVEAGTPLLFSATILD